ncbi:hypothetical protein RB597_010381 [Gaeumannomyces tritici]
MSDMHDLKKPKKGLSGFKLDIPLMGKGKKKSDQKEKKAAEFLLTRRGEVSEAANCSPDSGVSVVIDDVQVLVQVELPDANDSDKVTKSSMYYQQVY